MLRTLRNIVSNFSGFLKRFLTFFFVSVFCAVDFVYFFKVKLKHFWRISSENTIVKLEICGKEVLGMAGQQRDNT